jgi:hypothetical protein
MKTPSEIAREQYVQTLPWWRDAVTQAQALLAGTSEGNWPPPCEKCGALYKRTPKGRWLIDHLPEGHNEPRLERRYGDDS